MFNLTWLTIIAVLFVLINWYCLFRSLDESKGCGGTIRLNHTNNNSSYILKSPTLPTKTNLDCGWLILVEPSYVVQVQLVNYAETPKCPFNATDCRCSSIQVTDCLLSLLIRIFIIQSCSYLYDHWVVLAIGFCLNINNYTFLVLGRSRENVFDNSSTLPRKQ